METLMIYVLIVALFAGFPMVLDITLSYFTTYQTRKILIAGASKDKLDKKELKEFIVACGSAPPGIPGLARATMALTVILILGIAVFHLSFKEDPAGSQVVNNVLSMLSGLLAAITGFYFGGKSTDAKKDGQEKK